MIIDFILRANNNGDTPGLIDFFMVKGDYWFAQMLIKRFNMTLYYDYDEDHFAAGDDKSTTIYDITGIVTNSYNWQKWSDFYAQNEEIAADIVEAAINLQERIF